VRENAEFARKQEVSTHLGYQRGLYRASPGLHPDLGVSFFVRESEKSVTTQEAFIALIKIGLERSDYLVLAREALRLYADLPMDSPAPPILVVAIELVRRDDVSVVEIELAQRDE